MSGVTAAGGVFIASPDERAEAAARARQRSLTKPPGSLGKLEDLACWLAARYGEPVPAMPRCEIFVFAADHGVAARGVSAFPQAVTSQMVRNFAQGGAAINVLAKLADARIEIVDVGVASDEPSPAGVRSERVANGTRDLSSESAMSPAQAQQALAVGGRCASESAARGARLLIAGEMGIANTTAAACLICALTGAAPVEVVGRGTGLDDHALAHKREVVASALTRARASLGGTPGSPALASANALTVLAELGGFELAAIAGFYIEAARRGIPVLLDGYLSAAAALAAQAIEPAARHWMLASHRSAESGHALALEALGLEPLFDLRLRLGEGTGAALALPIVRAALALHREMSTFAQAGVAATA